MASSNGTTEFSDAILKAHNEYRAKHGSPNLKISEKLNKIAQEWSEKLAAEDKAKHRPDNPHGENIYMAGSTDPNWKLEGDTVVKDWYDEIKFYKFGEPSPKNAGEVGHFTQLVWKDTTELGIGEAKSKSGKVYVVCNYDPPGNVIPDFDKNVLPIKEASKNENGDGQPIDEKYEDTRESIVLAASQEKIDIQFVQPNIKIVESMERLYAVPSEKIRVWSVWWTKVEEKANEWNSWLRSHINLVLRMSEHLRRAEKNIKEDEAPETMRSTYGEQYLKDGEIEVEKASTAAVAEQRFGEFSGENRASISQDTDRSQKEQRDTMPGTDARKETIGEEKNEKVARSSVAEETLNGGNEMGEASTMRSENETGKEANGDDDDDEDKEYTKNENVVGNEGEITGGKEARMNEDETEGLKKIAWPIGVPWEPVASVAMEESEEPKKKEEEVKVIAIPGNEEDMQRLIRDVKAQATVFRSLYKHWLEVGDKAVKEVMNRRVMDSVPTDQEIPYFFYVNTEPDIEIGVEHDDEKVLLPDLTREKIISDFTPLYFNLADKPGKG